MKWAFLIGLLLFGCGKENLTTEIPSHSAVSGGSGLSPIPAVPETLVVTPKQTAVPLGASIQFDVEGGIGPYTVTGMGNCSAPTWNLEIGTYQTCHVDTSILTITDSNGYSVQMTVTTN